jgi:hypothetical protein
LGESIDEERNQEGQEESRPQEEKVVGGVPNRDHEFDFQGPDFSGPFYLTPRFFEAFSF